MIFLRLFLVFLKIGAVSFGGGYGMIPLMREECLSAGWASEEQIMDFVAVAESTPGPIAVNMATFIGSSQGGALGAFLATLGVVLPAFLIFLLVAAVIGKVLEFAGVRAALDAVRPAVVGLVLATAATMALTVLFGISAVTDSVDFDWKSVTILAIVAILAFGWKKLLKKNIPLILLIVISGVLGLLFFGL